MFMVKELKLNKLIIFIAIILGLGISGAIFNSKLKAQEPPSPPDLVQVKEFACEAYDPKTLKDCFTAETFAPIIKIIAPIQCKSKQECQFDLSTVKEGVVILATKPENKILRSEDYAYTLFTINNSPGLQFRDIYFEDFDTTPCVLGTECSPHVVISNSKNITIQNAQFNKTHGTSISINNSSNITITNSQFKSAQKHAIAVTSTTPMEGIRIDKNTFENNGGNAIIFQGNSAQAKGSTIINNTITNNHAKGSYASDAATCTYPCIGSQLKISGPTSNLVIHKNQISGGGNTVFDTVGLYTSGIEIGSRGISNLTLTCNSISDNRGSGVVQAKPISNSSNIRLSKNKIWQNGLSVNTVSAVVDPDNCYTSTCSLSCN